jgi:guanylate kinase
MLIIFSAPSGAGKTTIARKILRLFPSLRFSVSATTRPMRPMEKDGIDYHFLTTGEFEAIRDRGGFVEWELVFGNAYGTLVSEIDAAIREGRHIVFDVDVKGALSLQKRYPDEAVLIFIQPPDKETLRSRLRHRRTDSEETIDNRLARVDWELAQAESFDYVVINDELEKSVPAVAEIIRKVTAQDPSDAHAL